MFVWFLKGCFHYWPAFKNAKISHQKQIFQFLFWQYWIYISPWQRPIGTNLLLRWEDPVHHSLPMAKFIHLCELSGPVSIWACDAWTGPATSHVVIKESPLPGCAQSYLLYTVWFCAFSYVTMLGLSCKPILLALLCFWD